MREDIRWITADEDIQQMYSKYLKCDISKWATTTKKTGQEKVESYTVKIVVFMKVMMTPQMYQWLREQLWRPQGNSHCQKL